MKIKWWIFLRWFYDKINRPSKSGYYAGKIFAYGFQQGMGKVAAFMDAFNAVLIEERKRLAEKKEEKS